MYHVSTKERPFTPHEQALIPSTVVSQRMHLIAPPRSPNLIKGLATTNYTMPLLLPFSNNSMHLIIATRLTTMLPASQIPSLLSDCHRVLQPGGVLSLRLIDALPDRDDGLANPAS